MRKPAALLVGLALAAGTLTGCGGGDDADTGANSTEIYCEQLKADEKSLTTFGSGDVDPSQVGEAIDKIHGLADAAPTDIAPDWDLLDGTVSELERSLAEAGIDTDDLAGLQNGELPKGVDMAQLSKLVPKVQALNSQELQDATRSIQKHAKDECGVTLRAS